jgi:hypothetical protein
MKGSAIWLSSMHPHVAAGNSMERSYSFPSSRTAEIGIAWNSSPVEVTVAVPVARSGPLALAVPS